MPSEETSEQKLYAPSIPRLIERIGRYSVVKMLGSGGMATIYLARATGKGGFEKWVAIKRPHPHLAMRPNIVTMILNEARLVARLDHENICPIIDVDADEHGPYIVMPYMHGEVLAELIRVYAKIDHANPNSRARFIPPELVAHIGACIADGLHYAHNARSDEGSPLNVIHRDISPQNIFLTFQGSVKVLDFGVAKAIGFESGTAVGALKGKYAYMSPEQVKGETIDRRADLFSLGVVLWETLASRRLFRRDNDLLTAEAVAVYRAPLLSELAPHVPERLALVIDRALEPDRRDRYQTALDMSSALRAFLTEQRSFIATHDVQRFMAATFPDRVQSRDPLSRPTDLDHPNKRTATDDAVEVLIAFDEASKPDETVRMPPVSFTPAFRLQSAPTPDAGSTMPDQPLDALFEAPADDSQETTVPPPKPRSAKARGLSEETLRPPPSLPEELEEQTMDPLDLATERGLPIETDPIDSELAATVQLPSMQSSDTIRSQSEPLVVPVWSSGTSEAVEAFHPHPIEVRAPPPAPPVAPDSVTAKSPRSRRKDESERKLAQGVLGLALILLAVSIVLWARQCVPNAHAENPGWTISAP